MREYLDNCPRWKDAHYQNWECCHYFGLTLGEAIDLANQPDAIAHTSVSPPAYQPITAASQAPSYAYLDLFIEYSGLLFGGQGSGKSWTTRQIVAKKVQAGHRVVVLDPHAASHEWQGVEHVGSGMNYGAIAEFLRWYLGEVKRRYQDFSESGLSEDQWQAQMRQHGQVLSVVCEEMTNWADRLSGGIAGEFMKAGMSDSRKALMPPLFVAHDRTLTCLGDAKGLARLRDSSLLELELVPKIHEVSFKPIASGNGRLKLPGHAQWRDVTLPPVTKKITDFRGYGPTRPPVTVQASAVQVVAEESPDIALWRSLQSWTGSLSDWERQHLGNTGGSFTRKRQELQRKFGGQTA